MSIMVISDIHGSLYYTKKALEIFKNEDFDLLLILGDVMYHGPRNPLPKDYDPAKVAELLNEVRDKIVAVRGNCDSEVDQMLLKFPMLGDYSTIFHDGKKILASHGHIYNELHLPPMVDGDIFISGHIHIPVAKEKDGIYILNPGSISLPKEGNDNSYGIFKDSSFSIKSLSGSLIKEIKF